MIRFRMRYLTFTIIEALTTAVKGEQRIVPVRARRKTKPRHEAGVLLFQAFGGRGGIRTPCL